MFYKGILILIFHIKKATEVRTHKTTTPPLNAGKTILSNKDGENFQRNWNFRRISHG